MFAKFAACDVALKNVLVLQAFSQPYTKPHISSTSLQAANPIANAQIFEVQSTADSCVVPRAHRVWRGHSDRSAENRTD